jgi:hypothetical protein
MYGLVVSLLFVVLSITPTSTTHLLPVGTVEQFHVTVKVPSVQIAKITAAKIRIIFPHPIVLQPIGTSSLQGLTQLICDQHASGGQYQLYESSIVSPRTRYHGSLPRRLLPVWETSSHVDLDVDPFANFLLQTATGQRKKNEYIAIFPLSAIQTVITAGNGTTSASRAQTMELDDLTECFVRFVHPHAQIVDSPISIGFVGDIRLSVVANNNSSTTMPIPMDDAVASTEAGTRANSIAACAAATKYTQVREKLIHKSNRMSKIVGFLPDGYHSNNERVCVPMPSRLRKKYAKEKKATATIGANDDDNIPGGIDSSMTSNQGLTSLAETAAELFVHGEEGMAHAMRSLAKIGVPELGGLLMVPLKDVGKDFSQLAAGDMADSTTGVMQGTSAGQVDQSMTEQITGLLSRGLKARLTETLVPPLKQTIVASVSSSTTQLFQLSLTKVLTKRLERPLMEAITEKCTKLMPKHLDMLLPAHMARLLSKDLNHLLSRSVPHSLVPALVHTLTHSPMQDYYCFYCYHHKTYCQFCNYAPSQTYYAEFYTGFYSTYYGDYYMDNALRQLSAQDLTRKMEKDQE